MASIFKGKVDVAGRVSTPSRIKEKDASQLISLLNNEFLQIHKMIEFQEFYFDIPEMDELINHETYRKLKKWPFKTGLKSRRWSKVWFDQLSTIKP